MFPTIAVVSLIATIMALTAHYLMFGPRRAEPGDRAKAMRRWGGGERWLHALATVSFIALAVTGFVAGIGFDEFEGWWLWVHMLAAPVFAVSLTLMGVIWAERSRFVGHDGQWLRCGGGYLGGTKAPVADRFDAGQKVFFWTVLILGFIVLASMMAVTVSVFGQEAVLVLYAVHRYGALCLLIAVILHTYTTVLAKPGTWRAILSGHVSGNWARYYHGLWWSRIDNESEKNHEV
jgi:formate dehydrogenase subunit gamma